MTIESNIETALFTRVSSLALSPALPIAWPNVDFDPPADGLYLTVQHFPNGVTRYSQNGSDPQNRMGILQLTVITQLNKGSSNATLVAGQIAEHFNTGLIMNSGVAKVIVTEAPSVGTALKSDTAWSVPLSVSYFVQA